MKHSGGIDELGVGYGRGYWIKNPFVLSAGSPSWITARRAAGDVRVRGGRLAAGGVGDKQRDVGTEGGGWDMWNWRMVASLVAEDSGGWRLGTSMW